MHLSRYVKIYPCKDDPSWLLLYSTKRGGAILVPTSLFAAIEEGSDPGHPSDYEALTRLGFLVPDTAKERNEFRDVLAEANRRRKLFRAMVLLNMDCNLSCIYCYERGMKGNLYMSDETARILVEFVERNYISHGKRVCLTFHGGEPLMSAGLIIILSERLKAVARCYGVDYSFNLVTNGTLLTRQMVDKLIPLGLKGAKVSIDGPAENHNRNRPYVSGKGSFDTIVGNVKDVCDLIKVQVGGNYTPENYRQFPSLLDFLLDQGLTPDRISMIKFDPVTKSGGNYPLPEFNGGCASTDEPWLMEASTFLREEILKRGFHTPRLAPSICMVEGPDELVVNYDGTLFKCPAFLGWPELSVGDLQTGISDYAVSHNLDVWKKDECLDCEYLPLCFGGCRFLKLLREGRISDVDCRKKYLDETLETFVRQDLKYRPKRPVTGE